MKSIPIHFLEETLTFKLRGGSIKTMAGNGLTNIFWTQLTWFEYIVEEKKSSRRRRRKSYICNINSFILKIYLSSFTWSVT